MLSIAGDTATGVQRRFCPNDQGAALGPARRVGTCQIRIFGLSHGRLRMCDQRVVVAQMDSRGLTPQSFVMTMTINATDLNTRASGISEQAVGWRLRFHAREVSGTLLGRFIAGYDGRQCTARKCGAFSRYGPQFEDAACAVPHRHFINLKRCPAIAQLVEATDR